MCSNGYIRITPIFLFGIIFILTSWSAAEPTDYSLTELIDMGLQNNPQIEVARQQVSQYQGILTQAKSVYLPHLSMGFDLGQAHIENLDPDSDSYGHGKIAASQLIYDFGRATGRINVGRYTLDAAMANLQQQRQNVIYQIYQSYYQVLEKKQLVRVALRAINSYEQHLNQAKKYYQAGVRTKIDVTNAQVELSNAKLELLRSNANLKTAKVKLEQILGMRPNNGDYRLLGDVEKLEDLAAQKPAMTTPLEELLDEATQFRPGLKQARALVQATDANITQAKGDYYPSLQATGSYDDYQTDLSGLQDQWQISVGLGWEFFSGFETEGKVAEASGKMLEQQASLKQLELSIIQEVTDSYLRADANRESVDLEEETLGLAQEKLELAEGRYKAGLNDIIEYNDAQLTYIESQSVLVVTYYAYLTDLARIKLATGLIGKE